MKKGNVLLDGGIIIISLLFVVIGILWISNIFSEINSDVQSSDDISTEGKQIVQQQESNFNILLDNGLVILFGFLWLAAIISSYMIETHPVFFIISIILLCFLLFLSMVIGNTYEEVTEDLSVQIALFPKINFIMTHLLEFTTGIGISIAVALFAKQQTQ